MSKLKSSSSATSSGTSFGTFGALKTTAAPLTTRNQAKVAESLVKDSTFLMQQKKKRTALENISNASGSSTTASSSSAGSASHKPELTTKRSKYTFSSVISTKKSTTTTTTKVEHKKAAAAAPIQIKENLSNLIPSSFGSNLLPPSFNPSVNKTTAVVKTAAVVTRTSSIPAPVFQSQKSTSALIVPKKEDIVRQLATTSLDSMETSVCVSSSSGSACVEDWTDIDALDQDEFNCTDYAAFIFEYYRSREATFVIDDYILRQPNLNRQMRLLLVDWMVEVQQQLEFSHEVLYLSVKLLDSYLNARTVEKEKLQLLGGAAMFIACKFEERMPPIIDDFIYVSDNAYTRTELIKMEIDLLKTLKFDVGIPLSYTFLRRYAKCIQADMKFLTLARYVLELSLQDYGFASVKDSVKACAALYLAMKMVQINETRCEGQEMQTPISTANILDTEWNATLVHFTGSHTRDFIEFLPLMNNLTKTAHSSKYKTIFKKYSHQVFFEVAKIPYLSDDDIQLLTENSQKPNSF